MTGRVFFLVCRNPSPLSSLLLSNPEHLCCYIQYQVLLKSRPVWVITEWLSGHLDRRGHQHNRSCDTLLKAGNVCSVLSLYKKTCLSPGKRGNDSMQRVQSSTLKSRHCNPRNGSLKVCWRGKRGEGRSGLGILSVSHCLIGKAWSRENTTSIRPQNKSGRGWATVSGPIDILMSPIPQFSLNEF